MNINIKIIFLILQGFTYKTAKQYIFFQNVYKGKRQRQLPYSIKELISILPINKSFDKLFEDMLSIKYLLFEYDQFLPEYYCITLKRNGKIFFCDINNKGKQWTLEDLIGLLHNKKSFCVKKAKFNVAAPEYVFRFNNDGYFINNVAVEKTVLFEKLNNLSEDYLILEDIDGSRKEITIINENGIASVAIKKENESIPEIEFLALDIAKRFQEIEYMNFTFAVSEQRITILKIETGLDLVRRTCFPENLNKYIDRKLLIRKQERNNKLKIIKKYIYSYIAQRKGFIDYMYRNWRRGKKEDRKTRSVSYRQMVWAHRRGFYSYRIAQYGLTKDNYKNFLSDYDYKRLRPINNEYRKWLWDKLSLHYILKKYNAYLPEYYYHICTEAESISILKKEDCPSDLNESIEGVTELLIRKEKLALKPTIASHGEGFYKLEYIDSSFFINDKAVTRNEIEKFIRSLDKYYLVTEYVNMHKRLKEIYPNVASTIRIMVINRNGNNPIIENAYFRIGTSRTGQTDNIAAGGVFAHIDEKSGSFSNAKIINNHIISNCERHPDTDVKIEGKIPFWENICEKIVEISLYIFPLEYLGFDVVVTNDGFKILEINTHQDLHRYPDYQDSIKSYFEEKHIVLGG